jgi:hypothetical protein
MTYSIRRWAAIAGIILFLLTLVFWVIPWSSPDTQRAAASYLIFLAVLSGFGLTVYQLRATEIAISKSIRKPGLWLEVLPPTGKPDVNLGSYATEPARKLILYPLDEAPSMVGTRCALRIQNLGDQAASRIWLRLVFKRKGMLEHLATGRLDVRYEGGKQFYGSQVKSFDYEMRTSPDQTKWRAGLTFRFAEDCVIHADPYDRSVLAELDLTLDEVGFEPDFVIHYRIQSYEGNRLLESLEGDQEYPITFTLEGASQ